jgi:drug/metabolite transporter (DMT)-like permease
MLAFSAVVAGSFSLGAMIANDVSPVAVTVVRFAMAGVVLGTLAHVITRRGFQRTDFQAGWRWLLLGALFAGYFILMFEGLKTASPLATGALFTLTPLITAGFGWVLLRQRLSPAVGVALAIGAVGAVWVIFRGDLRALLAFDLGRGEAVYFLAVVLHAVFTPLLRKLNRGEPGLVVTALVMGGGLAAMLAFGGTDVWRTDWASLPARVWVVIAYLVVFTTALTVTLLQFANQRLPSAKVMAYTYLTPAWIIGWELALGNAGPGQAVLPGLALIIAALLVLLGKDEKGAPQGPGSSKSA